MKRLFLTSSFSDVSEHFEKFMGEKVEGKTVTFIPTASIPEEVTFYVDNDKKAFHKLGVKVDELDISEASKPDIEDTLVKNDYIFISGGNTFYLLQELKNTGADKIILDLIHKGKPYIGASAGSVVLSPDIGYIEKMDDPAKAPKLEGYRALGGIDFYPVPHYTNPPFEKMAEDILSSYKTALHLYPISNSQVIEVKGNSVTITGE